MAKKNSLVALMNAAAKDADRRRKQSERDNVRRQREAERELARLEREQVTYQRSQNAQQVRAEKAAHVASRHAQVDAMNAELATQYEDIDTLLAATLAVDDYVDLESLLVEHVEHPPFEQGTVPHHPGELVYPPEPLYTEPAMATGWGAKKAHEAALRDAYAQYESQTQHWRITCNNMYDAHLRAIAVWEQGQVDVAKRKAEYETACAAREKQTRESNEALRELINGLAFDVPEAIEEYVGVVLSNSVYPDCFPVTSEHSFDLSTRELRVRVTIPLPDDLPDVKAFKFTASKDEITSTALTVKVQRDRYSNAVSAVALRTLHEIFEADREAKITSISLTVQVTRRNPATGLPEDISLIAVAADRETFTELDLANVEPDATLAHLGAAVSKKPFDLVPIDSTSGVRTPKRA